MTIRYYNPTPKKDRDSYYYLREIFSDKINKLKDNEGLDILREGDVLNCEGATIILNRYDFLAVPLVELGGSIDSIRKAKSRLEKETGIKLRKTSRDWLKKRVFSSLTKNL